jgi:hypothetical protein
MGKDYLAMIADIGKSDSASYETNELHELSPPVVHHPVTPRAILERSRFGSLTRGALRDALIIAAGLRGWQCSAEAALLCIDVAAEAGLIVGPDSDGLFWAGASVSRMAPAGTA